MPMANGELGTYLSFRWRDEIESNVANNPLATRDSIINVNANVTYTWGQGDQFRVSAYGKNQPDEREVSWVTILPLLEFRVWNEGTRCGLQFDYNF